MSQIRSLREQSMAHKIIRGNHSYLFSIIMYHCDLLNSEKQLMRRRLYLRQSTAVNDYAGTYNI